MVDVIVEEWGSEKCALHSWQQSVRMGNLRSVNFHCIVPC